MRALLHVQATSTDAAHTVEVVASRTVFTPDYGVTASGYGSAIPTSLMVNYRRRWWRVRAAMYGNVGTAYIGKPGKWIAIVEVED
jgi:hypothetical protein